MDDEDKKGWVSYRTNAPKAKIKLCGVLYEAENSVLDLPPDAAAELATLAKSRGDISSQFTKLASFEEAEAIAKEHMKKNFRPQALKGGVTSAGTTVLKERDPDEAPIVTPPTPPIVGPVPVEVPVPPAASGSLRNRLQGSGPHMLAAAKEAESKQ